MIHVLLERMGRCPGRKSTATNAAATSQSWSTRRRQTTSNLFPWYDITCATCCLILLTVRLAPDDEPVKPPCAYSCRAFPRSSVQRDRVEIEARRGWPDCSFLCLCSIVSICRVSSPRSFAGLKDDSRRASRPQPAGAEADRRRAQEPRHGSGHDQSIALFAGINAVPKRSYLAAYSSRIDHKICLRFMEAWLDQVEQAGLPHGASFDLDFHSVPANSAEEPLEKHYVSSRSRSQKGILVFLARDAEQQVLRYANAGVTKGEQADEIVQFIRFWKKHTGKPPAELVFDSQLTTYEKLLELNREGICFITLRRRSEKMLREIYSQPGSAWRRINLPALTRIYRNPKVLEERVTLSGYEGELRQLTIMELGHEEPTVLLTNHRKLGPVELVTRYAQRMLIENGISEAVQFFHIDALSSIVGMKVDFDMQLTLVASSLYRIMA